MKNKQDEIPLKELQLNLEKQNIKPDSLQEVGYKFDKNRVVIGLMFPKELLE